MPFFTLRERFHRICHSQSKDRPQSKDKPQSKDQPQSKDNPQSKNKPQSKENLSSRSSTTEKADEAPPSYLTVRGFSSPQTVRPLFEGCSVWPTPVWLTQFATRPDLVSFQKDESRKRINDELSRLIMQPTSTVQWAKDNRFRNADRFRNFLYHCLLWQYRPSPVSQIKLSKEDERHFVLLWCFVSEWWTYYRHEYENISDDDKFINRVKKYTDIHLNDPIGDILHLKLYHVFDIIRAWLGEVRRNYSGHLLPKYAYDYPVEAAAKRGDWQKVGETLVYDMKLVNLVAPYGDEEARTALMNAVRRHQQYYLARAAENIWNSNISGSR